MAALPTSLTIKYPKPIYLGMQIPVVYITDKYELLSNIKIEYSEVPFDGTENYAPHLTPTSPHNAGIPNIKKINNCTVLIIKCINFV